MMRMHGSSGCICSSGYLGFAVKASTGTSWGQRLRNMQIQCSCMTVHERGIGYQWPKYLQTGTLAAACCWP